MISKLINWQRVITTQTVNGLTQKQKGIHINSPLPFQKTIISSNNSPKYIYIYVQYLLMSDRKEGQRISTIGAFLTKQKCPLKHQYITSRLNKHVILSNKLLNIYNADKSTTKERKEKGQKLRASYSGQKRESNRMAAGKCKEGLPRMLLKQRIGERTPGHGYNAREIYGVDSTWGVERKKKESSKTSRRTCREHPPLYSDSAHPTEEGEWGKAAERGYYAFITPHGQLIQRHTPTPLKGPATPLDDFSAMVDQELLRHKQRDDVCERRVRHTHAPWSAVASSRKLITYNTNLYTSRETINTGSTINREKKQRRAQVHGLYIPQKKKTENPKWFENRIEKEIQISGIKELVRSFPSKWQKTYVRLMEDPPAADPGTPPISRAGEEHLLYPFSRKLRNILGPRPSTGARRGNKWVCECEGDPKHTGEEKIEEGDFAISSEDLHKYRVLYSPPFSFAYDNEKFPRPPLWSRNKTDRYFIPTDITYPQVPLPGTPGTPNRQGDNNNNNNRIDHRQTNHTNKGKVAQSAPGEVEDRLLSQKKRELFLKFKDQFLRCLDKLKRLKLTPNQFINEKVFSSIPFEKPYSREFIKAAKEGNIAIITTLLKTNRYLVHDFDHLEQTALHWSVKRNLLDLSQLLINSGASVNAQDNRQKTPLHIAAIYNHLDCVNLLLRAKADPYITCSQGLEPSQFTTDLFIQTSILKAKKIITATKFFKSSNKDQLWTELCNEIFQQGEPGEPLEN